MSVTWPWQSGATTAPPLGSNSTWSGGCGTAEAGCRGSVALRSCWLRAGAAAAAATRSTVGLPFDVFLTGAQSARAAVLGDDSAARLPVSAGDVTVSSSSPPPLLLLLLVRPAGGVAGGGWMTSLGCGRCARPGRGGAAAAWRLPAASCGVSARWRLSLSAVTASSSSSSSLRIHSHWHTTFKNESKLKKNISILAVNASIRANYFRTHEVVNVCISVENQTEFFSQFVKRYLFSVSISASCLLVFSIVDCAFSPRNWHQRGDSFEASIAKQLIKTRATCSSFHIRVVSRSRVGGKVVVTTTIRLRFYSIRFDSYSTALSPSSALCVVAALRPK